MQKRYMKIIMAAHNTYHLIHVLLIARQMTILVQTQEKNSNIHFKKIKLFLKRLPAGANSKFTSLNSNDLIDHFACFVGILTAARLCKLLNPTNYVRTNEIECFDLRSILLKA